MRASALTVFAMALGAGGCAGAFVDGRVGGFFPNSIKDAKPGLGTEWHFGGRLTSDLAVLAGAGVYYIGHLPTGCRPGSLSSCTGPSGEFDSDTGGAYVAPLMGGLKVPHSWGSFSPFVRGEMGILYTEFSHGLEEEKGSVVAYRIGTGCLFGERQGSGVGIEAGLLRSGSVTYPRTVIRDYQFSGLTLGLTATW